VPRGQEGRYLSIDSADWHTGKPVFSTNLPDWRPSDEASPDRRPHRLGYGRVDLVRGCPEAGNLSAQVDNPFCAITLSSLNDRPMVGPSPWAIPPRPGMKSAKPLTDAGGRLRRRRRTANRTSRWASSSWRTRPRCCPSRATRPWALSRPAVAWHRRSRPVRPGHAAGRRRTGVLPGGR